MPNLAAFFNAPEFAAKIEALDRSQAIIEFDLNGNILAANENFLKAIGYSLYEIKGRHHRMFCDDATANSSEYRDFWARLGRGQFQAGEFRRIGKGGKEIWIQASYNPIAVSSGRPTKVVKFASDITEAKQRNADYESQLQAIGRSQAVIQFNLDGTIITANANFLNALGYTLAEVQGRHHSMFVDPTYRASREYEEFWRVLNSGKFHSGEFRRITKAGKDLWIQASYNPILDGSGKLVKVVKYATDITAQVIARQKTEKAKDIIEGGLNDITSAIQSANAQATSAATAASTTTSNVQAVAAGAEELDASVREIADTMSRSRTAADSAHDLANSADSSTKRLADAMTAMSGIVDLIKNIAGQINLLALNATIESARAGEAGKGFAVVANEVKNLAGQASRATEQISSEIEALQTASNDVVGALGNIKKSIIQVREFVVSTAGAVEEQSAVTREMSSNMQSAADAVASIGRSLGDIADSTNAAEQSANHIRTASQTIG
jgi:methyl-accepting chemotaxis protein